MPSTTIALGTSNGQLPRPAGDWNYRPTIRSSTTTLGCFLYGKVIMLLHSPTLSRLIGKAMPFPGSDGNSSVPECGRTERRTVSGRCPTSPRVTGFGLNQDVKYCADQALGFSLSVKLTLFIRKATSTIYMVSLCGTPSSVLVATVLRCVEC
jgi:hypothetical protein